MTDFRALCAALIDEVPYESPTTCLIRAALAQPEPEFTAEEVEMIQAPWSYLSPPQLPNSAVQALIEAECALADIAEGEGEGEDDDTSADALEWAEQRAAKTLTRIRSIMREYGIPTSEWPPIDEEKLNDTI